MKKFDHFDMCVLNSSPLLLPADGLKPGDKSLDLPFCLMRAARRAFEDWVKTHPKDWKETVRQARETGATEICGIVLTHWTEDADDDYAEWMQSERGY